MTIDVKNYSKMGVCKKVLRCEPNCDRRVRKVNYASRQKNFHDDVRQRVAVIRQSCKERKIT